jgi:hypothetical protein
MKNFSLIFFFCLLFLLSCSKDLKPGAVKNVQIFHANQIVYWDLSPASFKNESYLSSLDSIIKIHPNSMIYIREGKTCNFSDYEKMTPIFQNLLSRAHEKGVKIGLKLSKLSAEVQEQNCLRILSDGEITLDKNGNGVYKSSAKSIKLNALNESSNLKAFRTNVYRVFAFKKLSNDVYDPESLKDITAFCSLIKGESGESATIQINGNDRMAGYTAYLMSEHLYNHQDVFSSCLQNVETVLRHYATLPFDGTALGELGFVGWSRSNDKFIPDLSNEKIYSSEIANKIEKSTQMPAEVLLFNMRYYPKDSVQMRTNAVKLYQDILRQGPLFAERKFYKLSKNVFGPSCYIGIHDTFYNLLTGEDMRLTGVDNPAIIRRYSNLNVTNSNVL